MAFISLSETANKTLKRRSGRGSVRNINCLGVAIHNQTNQADKKAPPAFSLVFTLYPGPIKAARFLRGDRVDLLFDADSGLCVLRRCPEGRWSLSGRQTGKARNDGTLRFQLMLTPGVPYYGINRPMPLREAEWELDEETGNLIIQLPKHPCSSDDLFNGRGW